MKKFSQNNFLKAFKMSAEATNSNDGTKPKSPDYKREASWPSVLFFIHLNILGLYGIVILFTHTRLITICFCKFKNCNFSSIAF